MSIQDDLLPEMIMPEPKTEPNISAVIKDPDFPDAPSDDDEGDIPTVDYESEDDIAPEPKKRVVIPKADIFKSAPSTTDKPVVQKIKQKRKPRGPPSEKQLEALARARAKGAETRKKKAEDRKQIKLMEKELKEQELSEKKKSLQRKLKRVVVDDNVERGTLSDEEEEEIVEKPKRAIKPPVNKKVVEDTIEKAVSKGIAEYEMKRKERKKEKQERIAKEQHEKKILNTVHKAIDPDAYWEQCFR